jgi:hypothetical protein
MAKRGSSSDRPVCAVKWVHSCYGKENRHLLRIESIQDAKPAKAILAFAFPSPSSCTVSTEVGTSYWVNMRSWPTNMRDKRTPCCFATTGCMYAGGDRLPYNVRHIRFACLPAAEGDYLKQRFGTEYLVKTSSLSPVEDSRAPDADLRHIATCFTFPVSWVWLRRVSRVSRTVKMQERAGVT